MHFDENKIAQIVERVVSRINNNSNAEHNTVKHQANYNSGSASKNLSYNTGSQSGQNGIFPDLDAAVSAAEQAQKKLVNISLAVRAKMIESMREFSKKHVDEFSKAAVQETGLGRYEDKINKNMLAITKTPGIEDLNPSAVSGDNGLMLTENAPWGVIGAIAPCTNPTETIICNSIGMIAGGNAVVFNGHPSATNLSARCIQILNQAIVAAGGPDNLIAAVSKPTIATAQALMKHELIRLLVVTGGPAVVKAAMGSGKKVIAAGPGNPPVVVDETANIDRAAKSIIQGASLDNNIVCVVEKEIIVVDEVANMLKNQLKKEGAYELKGSELSKLERLLVKDNDINKSYVGKNVSVILGDIGVRGVSDSVRIAYCEVNEQHPFVQLEQLMPIIPLVKTSDVDSAIEMAVRVEHGFRHTAVMHSTNIENLHKMGRAVNTSIFVKNAPAYAGLGFGGEGYTSFTIASPTGEGITSAKDFVRKRRCTLKDYFRIV